MGQVRNGDVETNNNVRGFDVLTEAEKLEVEWTIYTGIRNGIKRETVYNMAQISADHHIGIGFANLRQTSADGDVTGVDAACYTGKDGRLTIYIDPNTKRSIEAATLHELSHTLEGTEGYEVLHKMAEEYYDRHPDKRTEIESAYRSHYEAEGLTATEDIIQSELTAHYIETMLADRRVLNTLTKKAPTVMEKSLNWIKGINKLFKKNAKFAESSTEIQRLENMFNSVYVSQKHKVNSVQSTPLSATAEGKRKQRNRKRFALEQSLRTLGQYTDAEIASIESNAKYKTLRSYDEIAAFIQHSLNNKETRQLFLGKINKSLADKIYNATGIDVADKSIVLHSNDVAHMFKQHGSVATEAPRGQIAVTPSNVENVIETLITPDEVSSDNINGNTGIIFTKEIDSHITAVTIMSNKKKTLTLKTAWIMKKQGISPTADAFAPSSTPIARWSMNPVPTNSIPQNVGMSTTNKPKHALSRKMFTTDSEGKVLTAEQKRYFKDSKVVDGEGRLLRVYHGTPNPNFTVFKRSEDGALGQGIYFAESSDYAKGFSFGAKPYEVYLNIKNPYRVKYPGGLDMQKLIDKGYDGVYHEQNGFWVAFDSNQIKRVDNTAPTTNPDIRYALGGRGNGYDGYSMSNNARAAYDAGEKPYSRWTKADLLEVIPEEKQSFAKKLTVGELRSTILKRSSWHHTSGYYNKTYFYSVDESSIDSLTAERVENIVKSRAKADTNAKTEAKPKYITALVTYDEWEGSRKHPKRVTKQEIVRFMSGDKMVTCRESSNRQKRLSSLNILYQIEQSTKYASDEQVTRKYNASLSSKSKTAPKVRYALSATDSNGKELSTEQQAYFKNSKVVDENGYLMPVYHGTMAGAFTVFDASKANVESDMGAGFYFSSEYDDVYSNYENGGQDLTAKIERRAEQIEAEEDIDYDEAKERATAELAKESKLYEVYLDMKKPAYVGGEFDSATILFEDISESELNIDEFHTDEDYYDALWQEKDDKLADIMYDVDSILSRQDIYGYEDWAAILEENGAFEAGITISEMKEILGSNMYDVYDGNGNLATNELVRAIVEALGYDGIIDNSVVDKWGYNSGRTEYMDGITEETRHYIAFKPKQIKLTSNTAPTTNPDIRYALRTKGEDRVMTELSNDKIGIRDVLTRKAKAGDLISQYRGGGYEFTEGWQIAVTNAQAGLERVMREIGISDATAVTNYVRAGKYAAYNALDMNGAQYSLDGEVRLGDSWGKIWKPIYQLDAKEAKAGKTKRGQAYAKFQEYLLHYHNIDRIARESLKK